MLVAVVTNRCVITEFNNGKFIAWENLYWKRMKCTVE